MKNLHFTILAALLATASIQAAPPDPEGFLSRLKASPSRVEDTSGKVLGPDQVAVERAWSGDLCTASIRNVGKEPVRLRNIILFDLPEHGLDPKTPVYGEGFQKLSQNSGTLAKLTWGEPTLTPFFTRFPSRTACRPLTG
jgi:hypothetical protein